MSSTSTPTLKIDFVSDVTCPWCAVGLGALEQALQRVRGDIDADIHFQPFELNPHMGPEGQDVVEHLTQKYGSTAEQQAQIRATLVERGAEVGFAFNPDGRGRIWNTFDAHRLLHLAEIEGQPGQQAALKRALLAACHTRSEAMNAASTLMACAREAGLNENRVQQVLTSDEFSEEVRGRQKFYLDQGIHAVPAVVINERHLISGGQSAEVFEQALRQIASEARAEDADPVCNDRR